VWNTESGYLIESIPSAKHSNLGEMPKFPHALSPQDSQDYVLRAYLLGWALNMGRFYWFSWGDDRYAAVDDDGYTIKPATLGLKNLSDILVGSKMVFCQRNANGVWVVQLLEKNNNRLEIVWCDASPQRFHVPSDWGVKGIHTISGEQRAISRTLLVNGTPLFLY